MLKTSELCTSLNTVTWNRLAISIVWYFYIGYKLSCYNRDLKIKELKKIGVWCFLCNISCFLRSPRDRCDAHLCLPPRVASVSRMWLLQLPPHAVGRKRRKERKLRKYHGNAHISAAQFPWWKFGKCNWGQGNVV